MYIWKVIGRNWKAELKEVPWHELGCIMFFIHAVLLTFLVLFISLLPFLFSFSLFFPLSLPLSPYHRLPSWWRQGRERFSVREKSSCLPLGNFMKEENMFVSYTTRLNITFVCEREERGIYINIYLCIYIRISRLKMGLGENSLVATFVQPSVARLLKNGVVYRFSWKVLHFTFSAIKLRAFFLFLPFLFNQQTQMDEWNDSLRLNGRA